MYSVRPAPLTRTLPSPEIVRAETTTLACELDRAPTAAETPVTSTIAAAIASSVGSLLTRISYETSWRLSHTCRARSSGAFAGRTDRTPHDSRPPLPAVAAHRGIYGSLVRGFAEAQVD